MLMPGQGISLCVMRGGSLAVLALSTVGRVLTVMSRQTGILGGVSVLCHHLQYVEKKRRVTFPFLPLFLVL